MNALRAIGAARRRVFLWTLPAVLAAAMLPGASACLAAERGNSLDLVPDDAAFFSASLRHREIFDIIAGSNTWARIKSIPAVQLSLQMAQAQLNARGGPFDEVRRLLAVPENQQLLDLGIDMASHEIFVYGGADWTKLMVLLQQLNATMFQAQMAGMMQAFQPGRQPAGMNQEQALAMARSLLDYLAANPDAVVVPELVIGFKLTDSQRAIDQLNRLRTFASQALAGQPELARRLTMGPLGDGQFLSLALDGQMVPWHEIPLQQIEQRPGQYQPVIEALKNLKITVSVGVMKNYAVISVGDSNDHLARLGSTSLLGDRPEFARLTPYADQRLTSISYVSRDMMAELTPSQEDLDATFAQVGQYLAAADLDPRLAQRLQRDLEQLSKDMQGTLPTPGAQLSFSFLTPRGFEGYYYDWSQNVSYDASKRLNLVEHLGGSPILAIVARGKSSPTEYETFVKWVKIAYGYFEDFVVPQMDPAGQQHYREVYAQAKPLLERLDKATGTMLFPALADGQAGLVIDAKMTSTQWHEEMPASLTPLPMLEPALVIGVSDSELLRQAMREYRAIADEIVAIVRKMHPNEVPPNFRIPDPETNSVTGGTVYSYALPREAGLDSQIRPNAGLASDVAVLSISPAQTVRLLTSTPLPAEAGPLADTTRPLAAVIYFDFAQLIDAAGPWIDYVAANATAPGPGGEVDFMAQMVLGQVDTVLELVKVFRGYSSVTYADGDAMVTHSETHFQDVP